jgi:hypothetical protein
VAQRHSGTQLVEDDERRLSGIAPDMTRTERREGSGEVEWNATKQNRPEGRVTKRGDGTGVRSGEWEGHRMGAGTRGCRRCGERREKGERGKGEAEEYCVRFESPWKWSTNGSFGSGEDHSPHGPSLPNPPMDFSMRDRLCFSDKRPLPSARENCF